MTSRGNNCSDFSANQIGIGVSCSQHQQPTPTTATAAPQRSQSISDMSVCLSLCWPVSANLHRKSVQIRCYVRSPTASSQRRAFVFASFQRSLRALFMNSAVELHDPFVISAVRPDHRPLRTLHDKTSCIITQKPILPHQSLDRRLQSILPFIVFN